MDTQYELDFERDIINQAKTIIEHRWSVHESENLHSSWLVKDFAKLKLSHRQQEIFAVAFLSAQHRLLKYSELFFGTINSCAVYPREVVRACIEHNAAGVVLMHNHPSGSAEPSTSDIAITEQIGKALTLVDIRVLDHVIVGEGEPYSMAEHGSLP